MAKAFQEMNEKRRNKAELIGELALAFRQDQNRGQAFDELVAERLGINLTDLRCIDIVEQHGGITAGELAEAAHLTTGAVTAVLDRLERAGYAQRVRDQTDRRRVRVELTESAQQAAGALYGPLAEGFNALMDRYTADQLEIVLDLLRRGAEVHARSFERLKSGG
jgi:DNA-binding MarR family transcriptional regulator